MRLDTNEGSLFFFVKARGHDKVLIGRYSNTSVTLKRSSFKSKNKQTNKLNKSFLTPTPTPNSP